jgi:hypothetical protein
VHSFTLHQVVHVEISVRHRVKIKQRSTPAGLPTEYSSRVILYRVSQEDKSILWEVIVSVILSKNIYMYTCPIPNSLRDRAISQYSSKIVDRKRYYVLFLIPVFIVHVTKLYSLPRIIHFRKFHRQHQCILQLM